MPVRVDPSGRRSVRAEVQVPGPIHRVWSAVATDQGISTWFTPTSFELGSDGTPCRIIFDFGPKHTDVVTVTIWDPPRRFVVRSSDFIRGGPPITTEWNVHDGGGGSCCVRVEHRTVADTDEWDSYLEGAETGWPSFFENLKAYLT